ncbi:hypothetical protein HWV62_15501 [Athelia sp. TMB]|nr:hypothetical protein HWV62_15501 [Athelia sp. TMB]
MSALRENRGKEGDAQGHAAEVDGDEGRVGDEVAVGREERAGEVEALFDVGADGCLLKRAAHGLGDAHEAVREEGEQDGVGGAVVGRLGRGWHRCDCWGRVREVRYVLFFRVSGQIRWAEDAELAVEHLDALSSAGDDMASREIGHVSGDSGQQLAGLKVGAFGAFVGRMRRMRLAEALDFFPVSWPLVGQRIQSIIDGKASPRDTAALSDAWKKLQLWGNMTCAGDFGVVADVIGWKDTINDRGANWPEAFTIYQWLIEAVKGLKDQKTRECVLICSKSDILKIWDYGSGTYTEFNQTMAVQAREDAGRWLGSIESGREVAIHMLTNRSGKTKCITCHHSARGSNKPKHGDGLRGDDEDYLDCRCPVDSSLLEAFILKVCRKAYPDFPYRPLNKNDEDGGYPHSDFAFNPVTLGLVERVIADLTGLTVDKLLQQREARLLSVITSATCELYDEYKLNPDVYSDECQLIKKFRDRVYYFQRDLMVLQEENELPGGKPQFQGR